MPAQKYIIEKWSNCCCFFFVSLRSSRQNGLCSSFFFAEYLIAASAKLEEMGARPGFSCGLHLHLVSPSNLDHGIIKDQLSLQPRFLEPQPAVTELGRASQCHCPQSAGRWPPDSRDRSPPPKAKEIPPCAGYGLASQPSSSSGASCTPGTVCNYLVTGKCI